MKNCNNIGKLDYFFFTCNLNVLKMFLRKKTLFRGVSSMTPAKENENFDPPSPQI